MHKGTRKKKCWKFHTLGWGGPDQAFSALSKIKKNQKSKIKNQKKNQNQKKSKKKSKNQKIKKKSKIKKKRNKLCLKCILSHFKQF